MGTPLSVRAGSGRARDGRDILETAAIPVYDVTPPSEELTNLGVEFGACSYWPVPLIGSSQPIQILQRRPTRYKGVIYVPSLTVSLTTVIQLILAASGTPFYNPNSVGVNVTVTGGTVTIIAVNGVTTGLTSGTVYVPAGGTLTITYSVAPTISTAYPAGVTVPATVATGLALSHRQDYLANPNNPQGIVIATVPFTIQWENQQPCYAAAIGNGPVNVYTLDQAQSAVGAPSEERIQSREFQREVRQQESSGNPPNRRSLTGGNQYK